jgi:hypothetical protein
MMRIEFLKKKWFEKITASAALDHSMPQGGDLVDLLLGADPTVKKLYAEFIFRCYANREYLVEDVERIRDTLSHFHSNKRRLPVDRRDIGGYPSERDVWAVLSEAGLVDTAVLSGKASKRSDRNRAYLESEVATADGWTMIKLGSAFAATWWGMGTRWCTTEKSGRTYKNYADRGPLRVFISPEGVKHQLHIATTSLCDATDKSVGIKQYLSQLPTEFIPHIRRDVTSFVGTLSSLDLLSGHEFRFSFNGILKLPREFFSAEISAAVDRLKVSGLAKLETSTERDGWTLKVAKDDHSSWALREDAGEDYDSTDRYRQLSLVVAPDGVTYHIDFGKDSFDRVLPIIGDMPPSFRETLLKRGVKCWRSQDCHDRQIGVALSNAIEAVPFGEFSTPFWSAWAKKLGAHDAICIRRNEAEARFGSMPHEVITEDVAMIFAKQGLRDRIPDTMLTRAVARTLAKADPYSRTDPDVTSLFTLDDIADVYGGNSGKHLAGLPVEYRSHDMARRIVNARPGALKVLIATVRKGEFDLGKASVEQVAEELTLAAIEHSASSLVDVDLPLTKETYLDIVRRDAGMVSWVPLAYRDVELCSASISHSTHGLCHFPQWVVMEIRGANDGGHGITHNWKPSEKYAATLRTFPKPEGELPSALLPFSVKAFTSGQLTS